MTAALEVAVTSRRHALREAVTAVLLVGALWTCALAVIAIAGQLGPALAPLMPVLRALGRALAHLAPFAVLVTLGAGLAGGALAGALLTRPSRPLTREAPHA